MAMRHASPPTPQTAAGSLFVPAHPHGLVLLVRAAVSAEVGSRLERGAAALQRASFAALLLDPLTREEMIEDPASQFDLDLLTVRIVAALSHVTTMPGIAGLPVGCWAAGAGAAAVLATAVERPDLVRVVVSCSGRPDVLDARALSFVRAHVLLIVGEMDREVIALNHFAIAHLQRAQLHVIPRATRLVHDAGAFDTAFRHATAFFDLHLARPAGALAH